MILKGVITMKNLKFVFGLLATLLTVSCGPTTNPTTDPSVDNPPITSTEDPTSNPTSDPTSYVPTGPIDYVSFEEAIKNTENNYSLSVDSIGRKTLLEVYTKGLYLTTLQKAAFTPCHFNLYSMLDCFF